MGFADLLAIEKGRGFQVSHAVLRFPYHVTQVEQLLLLWGGRIRICHTTLGLGRVLSGFRMQDEFSPRPRSMQLHVTCNVLGWPMHIFISHLHVYVAMWLSLENISVNARSYVALTAAEKRRQWRTYLWGATNQKQFSVSTIFYGWCEDTSSKLMSLLYRAVTVLDQDRSDRSWSWDQRLVFLDKVGSVLQNCRKLTIFCRFCCQFRWSSSDQEISEPGAFKMDHLPPFIAVILP